MVYNSICKEVRKMIDKQIKTKGKSNCETCIHNVVCKEKENYNKYVLFLPCP